MNFMLLGLLMLAVGASCAARKFAWSGKTGWRLDRAARPNVCQAVTGGLPWVASFRPGSSVFILRSGHSLARQTWAIAVDGGDAVSRIFFALTPKRKALTAVACTLAAVSQFSGCTTGESARQVASQAWATYDQNYARSASVETGLDGQPKLVLSLSRRPADTLTQAQIAQLMDHFAAYAKASGKTFIPVEASR